MNTRYWVLFFLIALTVLLSCKNNDDVFPAITYTDLTVVNASPSTLNFFLNGTRQNNESSLYPTGYEAHLPLPSGQQNYQFKLAGSSTILFSAPLNLTANRLYSLYVTSESASGAFIHQDTLYRDTLPNMTTIRFVHAAPDIGNLDVYVGDTVNFKNRVFTTTSVFWAIGSGQKEVKIFQTGSSVPKVDTVITFEPNQIYTLFSKGLVNGKGGSVFGVGVVVN
jgi:hypothetical protein